MNNFNVNKLILNKADNAIRETFYAKSDDANGRRLQVQITDNGLVIDTTGYTMALGFRTSKGTTGLASFDIVDVTKGLYEIYYPTSMMVPGTAKAEIKIYNKAKLVSSKTFNVVVEKSVVDEDTVVASNDFSLLQEAVVKVSSMETQLAETQSQFNQAVGAVTVDSEVVLARNEHATLKERLDSDNAELAQHKLDYVEDKKEIKKDISTSKQIAHYDEILGEYVGLGQFWNSLRNGKIYTTEFYQFDVSPSPSGVKKDDNEGLICEPSTNTERGRNDYEKIGLFMSIDVNAYVDENDDYHVIAIKGDGRFKSDGSMGDVYVMSMPGYIKRYKDEEVWGISYSDAMHSGFEVIDEAVKPDGTIRPYLLHAKYIAGRNPHENNNLASISGVPAEHVGMSHNGQIAEFKEKGIQYSGKTSHDDFYAQLMFWLKYATTHSQSVMYGAASGYYLQYSNLVSEVGVKRVIVTNSQANNLLIGSTVSIGDYGDGEISADRSSAQNSNLADRVNIINIIDLGDGNSAVYIDTEVEFNTSLTTTITTYPWNSGSCDNVLGQDGSPYDNLSGKEPFIINGIEMMVGGYEVLQNLIIHNNSDDDRTDVYVNYDCHTYSTSPTADYNLAGQLVPTNNAWRYGSKLSIPDNHPSVMLITEAEASSTTGFADGIYINPPSAGGHRAWRSLGHLNHGAYAGLRYLGASSSLAVSHWNILGRLSATGRSRRRAGVN